MPSASPPRVTRLVLFKHGVAYVERAGAVEGPFDLVFRREEMDDALKSLAAWVARGDARVGALSFDAPEDAEAALAARRLRFEPGEALEGLLGALRGRRVAIDDGARAVEGELVGFQQSNAGDAGQRRTLIVHAGDGALVAVDAAQLRGLHLREEGSRADLSFLLDRSRAATAEDRRAVRVSLSGPAEDVRVSYVVPAPVWRVSYRVLGGDAPRLMAWGIVHNPIEEDLPDVDLTLTTGEPVSFAMDLYAPKRVQRAVVEETARGGAAPMRIERAPRARRMMAMSAPPAPTAPYGAGGAPFTVDESLDDAPTTAIGMSDGLGRSFEAAAAGVDRAEFFEYRVLGKVSLKRGGSAMVPLVAAPVNVQRERIWREDRGLHPSLVLRFPNDTGAVLEEGPAVVYDEGTYSGEAMVPFTARGAEVHLAYANDLAVRCARRSTTTLAVSGIRLGDQVLVEEQRREERHLLRADGDHEQDVDVVFELPRTHGREVDPAGAEPYEETASYRRFRATVPARGHVELMVVERWHDARHVRYEHVGAPDLARWLEGRFLDRATHDALSGVLASWAKARAVDVQCGRVEKGRDEAYAKQQKLGEQLAVLKENGPEGALRLRYVKELEREQDKVNACEAEIQRLRDEAERLRARAIAELAAVTGSGSGGRA